MIFAKPAIHKSLKIAENLTVNFVKSALQSMKSLLIIERMKTTDAIKHFGSIAGLAKALNCNRNSIYQWGEDVPPARQYELEVKTGGVLISDYSKTTGMPPGRRNQGKRNAG